MKNFVNDERTNTTVGKTVWGQQTGDGRSRGSGDTLGSCVTLSKASEAEAEECCKGTHTLDA